MNFVAESSLVKLAVEAFLGLLILLVLYYIYRDFIVLVLLGIEYIYFCSLLALYAEVKSEKSLVNNS